MADEQQERTDDPSVLGSDEPLGKQAPGAPFGLVALSYMLVLIIAAVALAIVLYVW